MALVVPSIPERPPFKPVMKNGFYKVTKDIPVVSDVKGAYIAKGSIVKVSVTSKTIKNKGEKREVSVIRLQDKDGHDVEYRPNKNGVFSKEDLAVFIKTELITYLESQFISETIMKNIEEYALNEFKEKHPHLYKFFTPLKEIGMDSIIGKFEAVAIVLVAVSGFCLAVAKAITDISSVMGDWILFCFGLVDAIGIMAVIRGICEYRLKNRIDDLRKQSEEHNKSVEELLFSIETGETITRDILPGATKPETPAETISRVQAHLSMFGEFEHFYNLELFHTKKMDEENLTESEGGCVGDAYEKITQLVYESEQAVQGR